MLALRDITKLTEWVGQSTLTAITAGVLAMTIGWQGARTTWLLIPSPAASDEPPPEPVSFKENAGSAERRGVDVEGIVSRHLFGQSQTPESQVAEAPETKLDLELVGIYYESQGNSIAVIDTGAGGRSPFRVDDSIENRVRIDRILPEKVILSRDGSREVLPLETETLSSLTKAKNGRETDRNDGQTRRDDALTDAGKGFVDQVRPTPVRNNEGKVIGFRLRPTGGSKWFQATGLEEGDIVTAVDGTPLRGGTSALKALQSLRGRRQVRLTIQRNGRERDVELQLP